MEELSLGEKFKILFDNIFEHPLFIVILLVPAIMFLLQKKHGKKGFIFVYLLVIICVLFVGGEVIFELFDNLMDGLFMTLYFPNFITLFGATILCSIIALYSFFSKKMYRVNKIINITAFAIVQMLFLLILSLVKAKNINIYADNALYSNSDVLTLMQILIGTFALEIISILIINGINKVTDILDRRSTPLREEIEEQITTLEKTKRPALIKNIEIDNNKIGYINVADTESTSKPKLKPFKFDVNKLESIRFSDELEKVIEPRVIKKTVPKVLPKRLKKGKLLSKVKDVVKTPDVKKNTNVESKGNKFINDNVLEVKPNLLKPEESMITVIKEVPKPKLVHNEPLDLVDNLNIVDIQSTLDVVIRYRLMRGVSLEIYDDRAAVDNLQIPNFDLMVRVLEKCRLYKKV